MITTKDLDWIEDFYNEVTKNTEKHKNDILESGNLCYGMSNELLKKIETFNLFYQSLDEDEKYKLVRFFETISRDQKINKILND